MDITEVSIVHHIGMVLLLLWFLSSIGCSHIILYVGALLYLFAVNQRYTVRLTKKLQHEEQKNANQRRLLSDSESVRWLNHTVEKIWPICMEQIASQQFLMPILPWFLNKFKPWTVSKAVVENLYLGRSPPMFTEIRVLGQSTDDDHLVIEMGMSFVSGQDMSAILAAQIKKSLGLGIWTNMHMTGMHVEGKVLIGVKFLRQWPFIGRVRVCFSEVPYFQMTVKPIYHHGIDVTVLPIIAGWLDNLLADAFEQTLVEPNMLVIDVEKFVSTPSESWFSVDKKPPIAYVKLEIIEAAEMKPSDLNGLADPYVKGRLGTFTLRTKIHKKTLSPKWLEEFKIPISSWELPNTLFLEVLDKDHIFDDMLGECSVNISDLRGGLRHDKWLTLKNIKKGRLHLAITVCEDETEMLKLAEITTSMLSSKVQDNKLESPLEEHHPQMADEFEPIDIKGQEKTGLWVHRPGKDLCQTWEARKGRSRRATETELRPENNEGIESPAAEGCGSDELGDRKKFYRRGTIGKGLHKLNSLFQRNSMKQNLGEANERASPTTRPNIRAVDAQGTAVRIILDESLISEAEDWKLAGQSNNGRKMEAESPRKKAYESIKNVLKRKGSTGSRSGHSMEREESSSLLMEDKEVDTQTIISGSGKNDALP